MHWDDRPVTSLKKHRDPGMTRLNSAFKTEQEEKMAAGDLDGLAEMNSWVI